VPEEDLMPSPPFPSRDSDALRLIVENTMRDYQEGEVDVRGAILHAAVLGWYEGHIEGEDVCAGCGSRGELRERGVLREIWIRDQLRPPPGPPDGDADH
jgi:hypothetical protein